MSLSMFLRRRVVELQRPQTSSRHEQERDILNVFYLLFIRVLHRERKHESAVTGIESGDAKLCLR